MPRVSVEMGEESYHKLKVLTTKDKKTISELIRGIVVKYIKKREAEENKRELNPICAHCKEYESADDSKYCGWCLDSIRFVKDKNNHESLE